MSNARLTSAQAEEVFTRTSKSTLDGGLGLGEMRIFMLVPYANVSGPMPRLAELLVDGLRGLGCDVTTEPWGSHNDGETVFTKAAGRTRDVFRIRRALASQAHDLIVVQTSYEWPSLVRDLALALAIRDRGRRMILQFHGGRTDALRAPGHWLFKWMTTLLLRLTAGVLVLSSEERLALEAFYSGRNVRVVTNPFSVRNVFAQEKRPKAGVRDVPVILFAGRLLVEKGIFETIDAFALLRGWKAAQLIIVGDGPQAEKVAAHIQERNLTDDVALVGRLAHERLMNTYRESDVFVLPTYREGFPTVLSEAMSSGLPIVTTRTHGIADHLSEGVNALFVPPRDPYALAEAIERLLVDDALREAMSKANRRKVKEFAPELVARDYLRALKEIRSP
jgi:glycosyltransferase involved in cell wall biosynthesis